MRKDETDHGMKAATTPDSIHLQQLLTTRLFRNLPPEELNYLANKLSVLDIPQNTVLINEGERGNLFYIVISGELEVVKALGTVDERLLAVRGPGEFVGELGLLNPNGLRTASVRSRSPAHLLEITYREVDALLHRRPQVAYDLMHMVSARLSDSETDMFADLRERNRQLTKAYQELVEAQEQIVEKERLERELQVAHNIQMSILPQTLPELPGFDFGARIVPARAVGGDFFDIFRLPSGKIGIVIGDVADKGVPSAIFMARVHAFILAEAGHCQKAADALRQVNQHLIQMEQSSLFVTVLFGLLDTSTGQLSYARAGHELPLIISPDGSASLATQAQGQLLGFLDDPEMDEQEMLIPPGETILFYTDGLVDARNPQGEPFGYQRLVSEVGSMAGYSAQSLCDRLWSRMLEYQDGSSQDDDVTLVAVSARKNPSH
jgi:phosphoserine phosphatase RsbU/P